MVSSSETLLIAIIALPFVGSCLAMVFRANARNAEAYLAGFIALIALVTVIATYPRVVLTESCDTRRARRSRNRR